MQGLTLKVGGERGGVANSPSINQGPGSSIPCLGVKEVSLSAHLISYTLTGAIKTRSGALEASRKCSGYKI